jgi:succinoglycan biosynthesis protein ExoL
MPPAEPGCLAFFAHERGDARVRKRIAALRDRGWHVVGFTFHRDRGKEDTPPDWENIHLGTTFNRRYLQRLWAFVACLGVIWRNRDRLAACRAVYAVNTDNALLALLGKRISGSKAPLVLELADIQPAMVGQGAVSRVFRAIERFVLRRTALLVTTSPGFVREYFQPIQNHRGEIFLLENKVYPSSALPPSRSGGAPVEGGKPWVVGCFGAFRCRRSLELMRALATHPQSKVRFVLRGYPAGTITDEFHPLIEGVPGITFAGPYQYPKDLAAMYQGVDFNWAFDESDPNGNSAWLLPNRIYEGGCFGVPAIAANETETGRWISSNHLGWTFGEPLEKSLAEFFATLDPDEWTTVKRRCESRGREGFTGDADYRDLSEKLRNAIK